VEVAAFSMAFKRIIAGPEKTVYTFVNQNQNLLPKDLPWA